jgi:MSHA pilin protein MshD
MCINKVSRQQGVTLIELIVFIVIVGAAIGGILSVLNFTTRHSSDPLRRKQALMIAEALLEEVELSNFTYCDPNTDKADTATAVTDCPVPEVFGREADDTARPYDNVNDYAFSGLPFNDASGRLVDVNGDPFDATGYSATLQIVPESLGGIAGGSAANPNVLRITVKVTYGEGQVQLDGYRTRYAPQVQ